LCRKHESDMSDFNVISNVGSALKEQLNSTLSEINLTQNPVEIGPPREKPDTDGVSLWLYRVSRNGDLANNDRERNTQGSLLPRPLPLDLHYLITPQYKVPQTEQLVLGRIMQFFHTWPNLKPPVNSLTGDLTLRITPELLTVEQHAQLWQALSQPYRLSISYLVQCVRIDSLLPPSKLVPVEKTNVRFSQILGTIPD
jgi:hypothetical protein